MSFVNVGAWVRFDRPATKAALKRALADNPASVTFDPTSMFHTGPSLYAVDDITDGVKLSVCGPDPETSRKWFVTVERRNGKIRVS